MSLTTRSLRSRLANAVRFGHEDADVLRTQYDTERAIEVLHAIRGTTTPEQQQRLHDAVDGTAEGDRS